MRYAVESVFKVHIDPYEGIGSFLLGLPCDKVQFMHVDVTASPCPKTPLSRFKYAGALYNPYQPLLYNIRDQLK